jgi:hypothetical protein
MSGGSSPPLILLFEVPWQGFDEMDEVSGDGSALLIEDASGPCEQ